jgi:hypothetical protein
VTSVLSAVATSGDRDVRSEVELEFHANGEMTITIVDARFSNRRTAAIRLGVVKQEFLFGVVCANAAGKRALIEKICNQTAISTRRSTRAELSP